MASARSVAVVVVMILMAVAGTARAAEDSYPSRYVTIIVPFAPGGASDFVARIIQPRLSEELDQQVVIENKAGAAGNIGMTIAAGAAPDGYTLYLGNVGTLAVNPTVFGATLRVDPPKDFATITLLAEAPDMLVAHPDFPAKTVAEFVAYAKAHPGALNFASPGVGSLNALEMELFEQVAGIKLVHIPYKGGAGQAVTDVVGGQVPVMFTTMSSALGFVRAGKLRALAVTGRERTADLPDVPTLIEAGFPQMVASSWQAMLAPAKTPQTVIDKLHDILVRVMADAGVQKRLAVGGVEVRTSASPAEFASFLGAETKRWSAVAIASGATAN